MSIRRLCFATILVLIACRVSPADDRALMREHIYNWIKQYSIAHPSIPYQDYLDCALSMAGQAPFGRHPMVKVLNGCKHLLKGRFGGDGESTLVTDYQITCDSGSYPKDNNTCYSGPGNDPIVIAACTSCVTMRDDEE